MASVASAVTGLRIIIDPRGGLYFDEGLRRWQFQKGHVGKVQADLLTVDVAATLFDALRTVGAIVIPTRCLRRSHKEIGSSGHPLFFDGAGQYLRRCRLSPALRRTTDEVLLPKSIWDVGDRNLDKDMNARDNLCRYVQADLNIRIDISQEPGGWMSVVHNEVAEMDLLARTILKECGKRTHQRANRPPCIDSLLTPGIPSITLVCGSMSNTATERLLNQSWFRTSLALGLFAGIWKHYTGLGAKPCSCSVNNESRSAAAWPAERRSHVATLQGVDACRQVHREGL